jgi:hypothetical protein
MELLKKNYHSIKHCTENTGSSVHTSADVPGKRVNHVWLRKCSDGLTAVLRNEYSVYGIINVIIFCTPIKRKKRLKINMPREK